MNVVIPDRDSGIHDRSVRVRPNVVEPDGVVPDPLSGNAVPEGFRLETPAAIPSRASCRKFEPSHSVTPGLTRSSAFARITGTPAELRIEAGGRSR